VLAGLPVPSEKQGQSPQTLAKDYFEKATSLNPHFKYALLGQIHLACKTQPRPEAKDTQELGRRLQFSPFAPGDRGVLYGLKELAVAGEMCLTKQDIETLFAAAIANRTVDNGVRAMLWSWLADYQWLATKDIAGAKQALAQSLELSPGNPSNRLKWGQLQYISGELNPARKTLMALHNEMLSDDERKTLEQVLLNITMATNDPESRPQ
jgi:Tfp pilus assembly protein PilF